MGLHVLRLNEIYSSFDASSIMNAKLVDYREGFICFQIQMEQNMEARNIWDGSPEPFELDGN